MASFCSEISGRNAAAAIVSERTALVFIVNELSLQPQQPEECARGYACPSCGFHAEKFFYILETNLASIRFGCLQFEKAENVMEARTSEWI